MIKSYLRGKKTSLNMVLAFMKPPNEAPLSRETVISLFQQALFETSYPVPERLANIKRVLGVQ